MSRFIVANSKGCQDTVNQTVHMTDKPPIFFPFRDTLICNIDTLQLHAVGYGNFTLGSFCKYDKSQCSRSIRISENHDLLYCYTGSVWMC